jgi:hypothetical protein
MLCGLQENDLKMPSTIIWQFKIEKNLALTAIFNKNCKCVGVIYSMSLIIYLIIFAAKFTCTGILIK